MPTHGDRGVGNCSRNSMVILIGRWVACCALDGCQLRIKRKPYWARWGRPKGRLSGHPKRYPAVKKAA